MDYNISEGAVEFADRYRWLFDSDGNSLIGYPEEVVLGTRKSSKEKRILAFAAGFQVFHQFNRFWLVVFLCVLYWGNPLSVQLVKLINFFKRARWLKNRLRDNVESPRFKRSVSTQTAYRLRLKRLIPVKHDLSYVVYISSLWRPVLFACLLQ